jgi:O-antigen ligase
MSIAGLSVVLLAELVNASRGSWVATIIGLGAFILLFSITFPLRLPKIWVLIVILILSILGFTLVPEPQKARVYTRTETFMNLQEDKSYLTRKVMNQKGWKLFLKHPVAGVGPKRFIGTTTDLRLPKRLRYRKVSYFDERSAHNSYILLLAETGLLGIIPHTVLLAWLIISGWKAAVFLARRREEWSLSLYASFVAMSVHLWSLAGITLTAPWFLYGFMAAMIYRHKRLINA